MRTNVDPMLFHTFERSLNLLLLDAIVSPLNSQNSNHSRPETNLQDECELVHHEGKLGVEYSQISLSSLLEIVLDYISNSIMFCLLLRDKISNPDG